MKLFPRLAHLRGSIRRYYATKIVATKVVWHHNCRLHRSFQHRTLLSSMPSWRGSSIDSNIQFSQTGKYVKCVWDRILATIFRGQLRQIARPGTSPRPFSRKKVLLLLFFHYFDDDCKFAGNFCQFPFRKFYPPSMPWFNNVTGKHSCHSVSTKCQQHAEYGNSNE